MSSTITLIPGDGIGPEVAAATQRVLAAAGVAIEWEVHNAGAAVAEKRGTDLPDEVLESIRRNRVALKGPIGTPIGKGFRSVNVTLRQTLDLYANVRPVRSLPGVEPRFEGTDIVIVRENTEDLYAGLELMILPGDRAEHQAHHREGLHAHLRVRLRLRRAPGPQARHRASTRRTS